MPPPSLESFRRSCEHALSTSESRHVIFTTPLSETRSAAMAAATKTPQLASGPAATLVANHMVARMAAPMATGVAVAATPEARVLRFVRLVHHLSTAPWASMAFGPNTRIMNKMIAAHLHLVTGNSTNDRALYGLIDPGASLHNVQNLVWITNRQQGKTTTLGKFLAAISLAAVTGGATCLACVYSTKLERAGELLAAARQYLYWMQTPEGAHPEWSDITFDRDNEKQFSVSVNGGPPQTVFARPKNPDTCVVLFTARPRPRGRLRANLERARRCRGDAFKLGLFDEVAFTSPVRGGAARGGSGATGVDGGGARSRFGSRLQCR